MEQLATASAWTSPEVVRTILTILGIGVAIVSVLSVRNTAKKKQTADLLFGLRTDEKFVKGIAELRELHQSNQNMRLLADRKRKEYTDNKNKVENIRYILNHYERLSVGLRRKIYHEPMLKESQYNIVTKIYDWAHPFIEGVREDTKSDTAYQDFEILAKRWKKRPLKVKR